MAVTVLQVPDLGTKEVADVLDWIFIAIFPNYNMAQCFVQMYGNQIALKSCLPVQATCDIIPNPCCKSE